MEKLKTLELFSGYGTASFALKQLGIDFECIGYSDIDKYANQCFKQNHGSKELGDVTKINPDDLEDFDLLTGGFPCQTFSVAGKGMGELDSRGTLFNEIIRIAEVKKPKYMLLENVKGLTFKNHRETFNKILSELDRIGYNVRWKILNSKHYGIPQNRERVWFVCFKNLEEYNNFEFPEKEELKILLKDILEEEVDEKYYLKDERAKKLLSQDKLKKYFGDGESSIYPKLPLIHNCLTEAIGRSGSSKEFKNSIEKVNDARILDLYNHKIINDGTCITLTEPHHNNLRLIEPLRLFGIFDKNGKKHQAGSVWDKEKISPPLDTMQGGLRQPFIISSTQKHNTIRNDGLSNALPEAMGKGGGHTPMLLQKYRLRKLTPTECFRLQGFLNDEVNLDGLSNTQKYKLAGNGQSLNVVKKIFKELLK